MSHTGSMGAFGVGSNSMGAILEDEEGGGGGGGAEGIDGTL